MWVESKNSDSRARNTKVVLHRTRREHNCAAHCFDCQNGWYFGKRFMNRREYDIEFWAREHHGDGIATKAITEEFCVAREIEPRQCCLRLADRRRCEARNLTRLGRL